MMRRKIRQSMQFRIAVMFIALIIAALAAIGFVNLFFLDRVYTRDAVSVLETGYAKANQAGGESTSLDKYCSLNSLSYAVADENLTPLSSNVPDKGRMVSRLFGNLLDKEKKNTEKIKATDNYSIIRIHDRYMSTEFLELWGTLSNGNFFIVICPFESIDKASRISTKFYFEIGFIVIIISVFLILYMTRRFTAPIRELSGLSTRMAGLDFDARYTSGGEDEVGELGRNFNEMSDHLEHAISGLKSANAKLEKDLAEKVHVDEIRKDFLANVSHELKTPIALIQGYAEGLQDNVNDDPESREFYCDVIIDEAAKMNRMVKQLMTLNELEFGNQKLDMERFDLAEVIRGVLAANHLQIEEKGAEVEFDQKDPVPVWGDEFKIEEVITNYLTNALNHLEEPRQIRIRCSQENGIVTTSVFNTGQQIPDSELDRIWIRFYKVDKARTREYGGSGVGLSIVKAIMDGHRQKCWAENKENGVEFSFTMENNVSL